MEDSGYGSFIVDNVSFNGSSVAASGASHLTVSPTKPLRTNDVSRKRKCDTVTVCITPGRIYNSAPLIGSLVDDDVSPAKRALTDSLNLFCKIQSEPNSPVVPVPVPVPVPVAHSITTDVRREVANCSSFDLKPFSIEATPCDSAKQTNSLIKRKRCRAIAKTKKRHTVTLIRHKQRHLDFIQLFTRESNNFNVISQIFSYLSDEDLRRVSRVSCLWRSVLFNDHDAYLRYRSAEQSFIISKENRIDDILSTSCVERNIPSTTVSIVVTHQSPPRSPVSEKYHKFLQAADKLEDMQTLTKCPNCQNPAVIEHDIAECTKCTKIWCIRCLHNMSSDNKLTNNKQCRSPSHSPRTELKEISPNPKAAESPHSKFSAQSRIFRLKSSPIFFYQNEDSSSSTTSSSSDDHLIRKYFITNGGDNIGVRGRSRGNEGDNHIVKSRSNAGYVDALKSIPKLSIKRALSFSKLSADDNSDNLKCGVLSDFSNIIDRTPPVMSQTQLVQTTQVPKYSSKSLSAKRKISNKYHVCHQQPTCPPRLNDVTLSPKDKKTTKQRLRRLCR